MYFLVDLTGVTNLSYKPSEFYYIDSEGLKYLYDEQKRKLFLQAMGSTSVIVCRPSFKEINVCGVCDYDK